MNQEPIEAAIPRRKSFEIIHRDNFDIVVNKTAADQRRIDYLLERVMGGIPSSWASYITPDKTKDVEDLRFFVDNEEQPQFLAKIRQYSQHFTVNEILRASDTNTEIRNFVRKRNSIIREISLSPDITRVLNTKEARKLAQEAGFADISFVEPLVAVINKTTGVKTTFYNFVPGAIYWEDPTPQEFAKLKKSGAADKLVLGLFKLFSESGIKVGDLDVHQFIIDGKHLHLIDVEGYIREERKSD